MGCDVHLHQEVKINGEWHHYRETRVPRDYRIFGKMAGVRGEGPTIAEPRGLPVDATFLTKFCSDDYGPDGHTHSWLNANEILELEEYIIGTLGVQSGRLEMDFWGYLFGNSWSGFAKYPESHPAGVEDVRFVFWFDN